MPDHSPARNVYRPAKIKGAPSAGRSSLRLQVDRRKATRPVMVERRVTRDPSIVPAI